MNENEHWVRCAWSSKAVLRICSINCSRVFAVINKLNIYSGAPPTSTFSPVRCLLCPSFIIISFFVRSRIVAMFTFVHRFNYHFLSLCSLPGALLERGVHGGIAPLILNIDTKMELSVTSRPVYPWGRSPLMRVEYEAWWTPESVWTLLKKRRLLFPPRIRP
jgi:hypothetical protein